MRKRNYYLHCILTLYILSISLVGCARHEQTDYLYYMESITASESDGDHLYYPSVYDDEGQTQYGICQYNPKDETVKEIFNSKELLKCEPEGIVATDRRLFYYLEYEQYERELHAFDFDTHTDRILHEKARTEYYLQEGKGFIVCRVADYSEESHAYVETECFIFKDSEEVSAPFNLTEQFDVSGGASQYIEGDCYTAALSRENDGQIVVEDLRDINHKGLWRNRRERARIWLNKEQCITIETKSGESTIYYYVNDEEPHKISSLQVNGLQMAGIYEEWFCAEKDVIIGKVTATNEKNGIPTPDVLRQEIVLNDYLLEIDPEAKTDRILYQTKDNTERIVGYKDRCVYVFKDGMVSRMDLTTKQTDTCIDQISMNHNYSFRWRKGILVVFNEDLRQVVGICR